MDIYTEMRYYLKENTVFSVPCLQKKFGVSYKTACAFVEILLKDNDAEFISGTEFKYEDSEMRRQAFLNEQRRRYEERAAAAKRREETLYAESVWTCIKSGQASVSLLQRKIGLLHEDAVNFIRRMEQEGYVSTEQGARSRKVYITGKRYREIFGKAPDDYDEDEDEDEDDDYDEDEAFENVRRFLEENERGTKKSEIQRLIIALKGVARKKSEPVCLGRVPDSSVWTDRIKFSAEVRERTEKIVLSEADLTRAGAVAKAEALLNGVRDTHDRAMMQVYERVVYDLKSLSDYRYKNLKKRLGIK